MRRLVLAFFIVAIIHVPAGAQDILHPIRLYSAAGHPVPVVLSMRGRVDMPEGGFGLILLDSDGVVLDSAEGLAPGTFDLGETLPAIWSLTRAARAQVIVDGEAVGTPIVVQPMLTPPKVRTVRDVRANSTDGYTRVIGFDDEVLDPKDADLLEKMKESEDWDPTEPSVNSGVRVYIDRDVLLHTEFGDIRLALAPEFAPNTAWNFRHLAEGGFYDDTTVHRIVHIDRAGERFVIQGGDPTGGGSGSAGWDLPMEPSALPHDLGVISMARSDSPHSAGSQWFICLSRAGTARLDGQYIAFGWATEGEKPIARIADAEIADASKGRPAKPPLILSATLVPASPHDPGMSRSDKRIRTWWTPPHAEEPARRER